MPKAIVTLLVWASVALSAEPAFQACPQALNLATELGKRFDFQKAFPQDDTTFEIAEQDPNRTVRYIRLRMKVTAPATARWHLVLRDANGRAIEVFTAEDFGKPAERWTARVPGSRVRIDRYVDGDVNQLHVEFLEYVAMYTSAKSPYYSYQDPASPKIFPLYDDLSPSTLDDRRLGDATVFLMAASGNQVWTCSGVIVAPGLLMTNWHCGGIQPMLDSEFWNDSICRSMLIDASWDDDGRSREFACVGKPLFNSQLDVALLRIQPIDGSASVRPATLSNAGIAADNIKLIHHPEGLQKRISLNCSVKTAAVAGWRSAALLDFTHDCDTEGGSSGAPVYDKAGRVVIGLHHHGFKRNPQTCGVEDRVNKAVRMDEIVKWLDSSTELKALKAQMRFQAP